MRTLGLTRKTIQMRNFDAWLHGIPSFFIVVAFACCGLQATVEARIEAREVDRRLKREKASATLKKYFKKKQDKFDKVEYLGDMYKLMQRTLEEIKAHIAENERRTNEEGRDNMNRMLKDKYSVMKDLKKGKADVDITVI